MFDRDDDGFDWKPGEEARFNERVDERVEEMLSPRLHGEGGRTGIKDEDYWEALVEVDALPYIISVVNGGPEEPSAAASFVRGLLASYLRPKAEDWVREHPEV